MRDHLPRLKRELRPDWDIIAQSREHALVKRVYRSNPPDLNRRELPSLTIGDNVQIQNQHGNRPKRWYSTGIVTEVLPNRQYTVMKDGSRRTTLRNRRFLRKISPLSRSAPEVHVDDSTTRTSGDLDAGGIDHTDDMEHQTPSDPSIDSIPLPPSDIESPSPVVPTVELRRSARERIPRKLFVAKMKGQSHG